MWYDAGNFWVDVVFSVAGPDTTPPAISGISVTSITTTGGTVNWTTDEPADGRVEIVRPCASAPCQTPLVAAFSTGHAITLSGLTANTLYTYKILTKDALNNLAVRIPILDVRFFATAVLIQRETGGNLSEILDNLAYVVRERFKILRQVRVYTAHGRMTGYVLLALPATLAVALMFINPEHMNLLFTERMGRLMLMGTVVMQTIGYVWIRKIVTIEV